MQVERGAARVHHEALLLAEVSELYAACARAHNRDEAVIERCCARDVQRSPRKPRPHPRLQRSAGLHWGRVRRRRVRRRRVHWSCLHLAGMRCVRRGYSRRWRGCRVRGGERPTGRLGDADGHSCALRVRQAQERAVGVDGRALDREEARQLQRGLVGRCKGHQLLVKRRATALGQLEERPHVLWRSACQVDEHHAGEERAAGGEVWAARQRGLSEEGAARAICHSRAMRGAVWGRRRQGGRQGGMLMGR